MRSNFFLTAWRMLVAGILVELALVAALLRLETTVGVWPRVVLVAVLLGGPLGLLFAFDRVLFSQAGSVVIRASVNHPGSVVIPVAAVALSRAAGRKLGLATAGASALGGSPGAVVVLRDRLELWSGRSGPPRWSVHLADVSITVGLATVGRATWDVVQLRDEALGVAVAPRYRAISYRARKDIDRMLRELGRDPAAVNRSKPVAG